MQKINVKNQLPENNQYVLAHLTLDNWGDSDDPEGNRYFKVVKFIRGLSEKEREALPEDSQRKRTYSSGDVFANNLVPYVWDSFGPSSYFGQDVDYWFELPKI